MTKQLIGAVRWYNGSRGSVKINIDDQVYDSDFSHRSIDSDFFPDIGEPVEVNIHDNPYQKEDGTLNYRVSTVRRLTKRYMGVALERSNLGSVTVFCDELGKNLIVKSDDFAFQENTFIDANEYVSFSLIGADHIHPKYASKTDLSTLLTRFSIVPRFDEKIEILSTMAIPESWKHRNDISKHQYPVLISYVRYMFAWHFSHKTIEYGVNDEGQKIAAWNTGLTTPFQEEIFAFHYGSKEADKEYARKWMLFGFVKSSDRRMSKLVKKPELAQFFDNPSDLVYDVNLRLEINADHILKDNLKRFPTDMQINIGILQELLKSQEHKVVRRVRRNYRTAVPQYSRGRMQLLLPVFLKNDTEADVALLLDKSENAYRAVTVLTLPMAYNNARLVTRPDSDWL